MIMKEALNKAGYKGSGNKNKDRKRQGGGNPHRSQPIGQAINPPKIVFRNNGQLRRELLTSEAENWAGLLYDNKNGVTATQLRNFFNEVKALQSRIEAGGFAVNEAMIGLLKSKAAYAFARAEKKKEKDTSEIHTQIQ